MIESMKSIKLYSCRVFLPNGFGFVKNKPEVMIACKVRLVGMLNGHSVVRLISSLRGTIRLP